MIVRESKPFLSVCSQSHCGSLILLRFSMDSILNAQLQRTFRELQDFGEVKDCLQDILTQIELDEKDAKMYAQECLVIN